MCFFDDALNNTIQRWCNNYRNFEVPEWKGKQQCETMCDGGNLIGIDWWQSHSAASSTAPVACADNK